MNEENFKNCVALYNRQFYSRKEIDKAARGATSAALVYKNKINLADGSSPALQIAVAKAYHFNYLYLTSGFGEPFLRQEIKDPMTRKFLIACNTLMMEKNVSVHDLLGKIGVPVELYDAYWREELRPSHEVMKKLIRHHAVNPVYIWGDSDILFLD